MSDETIKPPATSDNSLTPKLSYYGTKARVKFRRSCSKQATLPYSHKNVVNIYTVYELGGSSSDSDDSTQVNCSSGAVTLSKNGDIDKYK